MSENRFKATAPRDDTRIITTGTSLDNSNAEEFSSLLMNLYSLDVKHIIVEMTSLEFLSSAGIGAIVGTVELFRERGGDIVLSHVSDKIMKILQVLSLSNYVTISASTKDAMAQRGA
jgi:anti-sigma B factor antagonist